MHSKVMSQTMSEEPCDVKLPLKQDRYLSADDDADKEFCRAEGGKPNQNEPPLGGSASDGETGKTAEDAKERQRDLAVKVDPAKNCILAAYGFPVIQGQTHCKSEEDDGYCSRSSLDSPVQTLQSDSEANDQEVFMSKNIFAADADDEDKALKQAASDSSRVSQVPASVSDSSKISSASLSGPHPDGRPKILIVNKSANVRHMLPTAGTPVTPLNVVNTPSEPPTDSASLTMHVKSVSNPVSWKILRSGAGRGRPDPTSLLQIEDEGSVLSTIPTTLSILNDNSAARSSCSTLISDVPVLVKTSNLDIGKTGPSDIHVDTAVCEMSEATVSSTSAAAVLQQQGGEVIIPGDDNHSVQVAGSMVTTADLDQDVDINQMSGHVSMETNSTEMHLPIAASILEQKRQAGGATSHITAGHNQVIVARGNVLNAANGSRMESRVAYRRLGDDLQNAGKQCTSSPTVGENGNGNGSATADGQPEVGPRSSTYQFVNHTSQDVTFILLPQNSVQSVAGKGGAISDAPCKQLLLRTGQNQLVRAISVNSGSFKTMSPKIAEKLVHANCDSTKLVLKTAVRGAAIASEGSAKRLSCREGTSTNKVSNTIVLGEGKSVEEAENSGKLLQNSEKGQLRVVRSSANIGHFASLTLPGLQVAGSSKPKVCCSETAKTSILSSAAGMLGSEQPKAQKSVVESIGTRMRAAEASNKSGWSRVSRQSIVSARKSCLSTTCLHPLIDHDYCEFSAFCADVQSSIISLTESSIRPERRYVKKNRAARTKAMRVSRCASESLGAADSHRPKRKYCKRKHLVDSGSSKKYGVSNSKLKGSGKVVASHSKGSSNTQPATDDKNYVKIPGCYQDDYVYYATKRLPGRLRNRTESASKAAEIAVAKQPASASGISVFDWYKEMAQTDKTTQFGSDCNARGSGFLEESGSSKDCTPVNESDVADLVMDLLPNGDLARPLSDEMKYMSTSIVESLLSNSYDLGALSVSGSGELAVDGGTDLNFTAEEVRMMLSSMGEAELKMLESHLENEKIGDEMHVDGLDINSYLGDYVTNENNTSSASNFLDVDDINDGDLLPADITNMSIILNDFKAMNRSRVGEKNSTTKLETNGIASLFDKGVNLCDDIMNGARDIGLGFAKTAELCKVQNNAGKVPNLGLSIASSLPTAAETIHGNILALSETSPPELTTINMFWNDLPGLMINGKEFVRLVDIHKQIMPAKDTGILKKRCHMMGLHITNCSELQRDFLIRYMNAAKSKSTVIVTKDDAIMLIGFYVNPKSRARGSDDLELDFLTPTSEPTKFASRKVEQPHFADTSKNQDLTSLSNDASSARFSTEKIQVTASVSKGDSHHRSMQHLAESGLTAAEVKRSERLRHKHISYSTMVHGGLEDGDKAVKLEHVTHARSSANNVASGSIIVGSKEVTVHAVSEQEELQSLIHEQKRRRLSLEEKLRLKLLRNSKRSSGSRPKSSADLGLRRTRRRLMKRTKRTRRLPVWNRINPAQKGTPGDQHTLEHCYAALPAHSTSLSGHRITRNGTHSAENEKIEVPTVAALKTGAGAELKLGSIRVIHRDVTCRVNRRRRSQIGELVPRLYTSCEAQCICCTNCREMLAVSNFLKHMHWGHGSEKLVRVTVAQKLQIQSSARSPESIAAWDEFQRKRALFESAPQTDENVVSPCKERPRKTTLEPGGKIKNTSSFSSAVPSTRHSSRVLKRKQLASVEKHDSTNGQLESGVGAPSSDAKKHCRIAETAKPSSPAKADNSSAMLTVANSSNRAFLRKKPPPSNSNKKRSERSRPITQSDRLLRVTARRSLDF